MSGAVRSGERLPDHAPRRECLARRNGRGICVRVAGYLGPGLPCQGSRTALARGIGLPAVRAISDRGDGIVTGTPLASQRRLSSDVRRWAAGLLEQQFWCWGRDITRPEGNVLLDLGMCRHRAPNLKQGCSQYTGGGADNATVILWGFGLIYSVPEVGNLFLRRYKFSPLLVERLPPSPIHDVSDLIGCIRPWSRDCWRVVRLLVRGAASWIAHHEHWVAENLGVAYRESALKVRGKPAVVSAKEMASSWEWLAKRANRLHADGDPHTGPWAGLLSELRMSRAASSVSEQANETKPYPRVPRSSLKISRKV